MIGKIYDWLDHRTGIKKLVTDKLEYPIPDHVNIFYCFGGLSFFIILLQVVSGFVMLFYYTPIPEKALDSVTYFSTEVSYGWLIRNMHRWAATLLVAIIFFNITSVFLHRAFRNPRELNWLSGLLMFVVVILFSVTGVILPWDWRSYWGLTIWADYIGTWPFFGEAVRDFLLVNFAVGRSFVFHVWLLPLVTIILLWVHFKMVKKHGISGPL